MKETKYSRLILKRTNITSVSATTAPSEDHTILPAWSTSDVYVGEFFLNTQSDKLWVRTDNGIKEIILTDGDSSLNTFSDVTISSPSDGQVLTYSGGTWVNRIPDVAGTGLTYTVSPLTFSTPMAMSIPPPDTIERLADIDDVILDNKLQNFDVLILKDGKWLNTPSADLPIKKSTINDLVNVEISEVLDEQILVYKNNRWSNKTKLDKILSLSWDKSESKLLIETEEGIHNLSIQGKPIHKIVDDIDLDNTYHTIIVDASLKDVNILLPPASLSYGDIFIFKIINYSFNTTIFSRESEFIYTESLLTEYIISEDIHVKSVSLQSDGDSTWYSI